MKPKRVRIVFVVVLNFSFISSIQSQSIKNTGAMKLNSLEYLEYQGVNVMLAQDYYPEGHQGGVSVIQNGLRVATNGDIRLEPTPGQWQPIPKVGKRSVDKTKQQISVQLQFPNEDIDRKGFNPVIYPDLKFSYTLRVEPAGKGFKIIVDLDKPIPDEWIGKVGFNFELFPEFFLVNPGIWIINLAFFQDRKMAPIIKMPMAKYKLSQWQKAKN